MCKDESSRVDFAMAEALAFGTLALRRGVRPAGVTPSDYFSTDPSLGLNRGHYAVRLSGQDSERGTFNQRHADLYDQVTGERSPPSCMTTLVCTLHVYNAGTKPLLGSPLACFADIAQSITARVSMVYSTVCMLIVGAIYLCAWAMPALLLLCRPGDAC